MGQSKLHTTKMARLDEALRRMFASCPAPRRFRELAEELAARHGADHRFTTGCCGADKA